jgi:tetratricopeptide (TPR) repeat protein
MALVESKLSGDDELELSVSPTEQARRVAQARHVLNVQLWPVPYRVLAWQMLVNPQAELSVFWQAPLFLQPRVVPLDIYDRHVWTGRVRYLEGRFLGNEGAIVAYQRAIVLDSELEDVRRGYDRALKDALVKQNASYWLGLLQLARGEYEEAASYFDQRTLGAWPKTRGSAIRGLETAVEIVENELEKPPDLRTIPEAVPRAVAALRMYHGMFEAAGPSPWAHGAKYNWARAREALGAVDEAIALLESDPASPQDYGNRVRAKLLRQSNPAASGGQPPAEQPP